MVMNTEAERKRIAEQVDRLCELADEMRSLGQEAQAKSLVDFNLEVARSEAERWHEVAATVSNFFTTHSELQTPDWATGLEELAQPFDEAVIRLKEYLAAGS